MGYNGESVITKEQIKAIVNDLVDKSKVLFSTKKETNALSASVDEIKGQLSSIIERIEVLEEKVNVEEEPSNDDENTEPENEGL